MRQPAPAARTLDGWRLEPSASFRPPAVCLQKAASLFFGFCGEIRRRRRGLIKQGTWVPSRRSTARWHFRVRLGSRWAMHGPWGPSRAGQRPGHVPYIRVWTRPLPTAKICQIEWLDQQAVPASHANKSSCRARERVQIL